MFFGAGGGAPFRWNIFHAWQEDETESEPTQLFPQIELDDWREGLFQMSWHQHGGSGLNISMSEALEMFVTDRDWFLKHIANQRADEARQIEKASKRK